eukprot:2297453-Amphidinium_carterae.1
MRSVGPALPGHSIDLLARLLGPLVVPPKGCLSPPRCVHHYPRTSLSSAVVASKCASPLQSRQRQRTPRLESVPPVQPGGQWAGRPSLLTHPVAQGLVACLCLSAPLGLVDAEFG